MKILMEEAMVRIRTKNGTMDNKFLVDINNYCHKVFNVAGN